MEFGFYLSKIESAGLRKCPYYHYLTMKVMSQYKHLAALTPQNGEKQLAWI